MQLTRISHPEYAYPEGGRAKRGTGMFAGQCTFFHLHQSHIGSQKHLNIKISSSQGIYFGNFGGKVENFEKIWEFQSHSGSLFSQKKRVPRRVHFSNLSGAPPSVGNGSIPGGFSCFYILTLKHKPSMHEREIKEYKRIFFRCWYINSLSTSLAHCS